MLSKQYSGVRSDDGARSDLTLRPLEKSQIRLKKIDRLEKNSISANSKTKYIILRYFHFKIRNNILIKNERK